MKKKIYIISIICFICDLISKLLMLKLDKTITVIPKFFYLVLVKNTGAAFSSFEGFTLFFIVIAIVVLFYIIKYINKNKLSLLEEISYSLLIGGILGNLFDRIVYNEVIDFLSFNFFGYSFPVFNLADVFICSGAFLMFIYIIREGKHEVSSRNK